MHSLSISYHPPSFLTANPHNARTHDRRQLRQIADSIRAFGFTNPILVDESNVLIAGHGRLAAAKEVGLEQVPVIVMGHLSSEQKRGLMLADNKIALNAGWDMNLLAAELADLSAMEIGFDVDLTGFEVGEIDVILEGRSKVACDQPDVVKTPEVGAETVTQVGDLWQLGVHRVLCGDARSKEDMQRLMGDERADAGFTDPPYNVRINGHVSGKGAIQHREFAEASGEMSKPEFTEFLRATMGLASEFSRDGAVWFACMDWRHMGEMLVAGNDAFSNLLNLCVWAKTNGGMGSLYRSQHELVFVFRKGKARHRNNVQLGHYGRNRTNIWTYAGVNTFRAGRMEELHAHPTAKPVTMVKDALLDVTRRGDIVLDPFLGAGATVIAAEQSGRVARGLEIDLAYVDVILRRWRKETGEDPVRIGDGMSFSALEEQCEARGES
ncbi:Modification methylase DpnIIB [Aliiroseovarius pelagivivens]|uniref:Methyltransferase n=1 Tax=Aliiroseovarius pelagivivens TaxID=1639690 RepID=A0A2R8AIY0_9RHOB|nr:DNA methyltransferase [Aliiroseovarius pelagivivens]SPF75988.1 Modification methylase DpnIIB [Aliiroseovarius pelagivivens]